MPDLSLLIPARNEMFLQRTIEDVLEHIEGDTEILAVCDGCWPNPPIKDHPRVHLIYHPESIGQRAATNEAAKMSTARFIMKLDAHCAVDQGFDVKLMADCERDWTVVPRMYNLHAFDWLCPQCGERAYQGPTPVKCWNPKCTNTEDFSREMVWKPRLSRRTDSMRFDGDLHFQYWGSFGRRPEAQGDLADTMSLLGACWFLRRDRYWELGGMDERHGSWGQMGTELACKTWLSGGRLVCNKKTWFSHMFRTQGGDFGFPYPIKGSDQDKAREHSRWLWQGGNWEQAKYPLDWLVRKFSFTKGRLDPVPGWGGIDFLPETASKGIVYYTDNRADAAITEPVRRQLQACANGHKIVSVSLQPLAFGHTQITLPYERGVLTMYRQILAGLEALDTDVAFLCEHDVLYHPSHFAFTPPRKDAYYYNEHTYKVDAATGQAVFYYTKQVSGLSAYRPLLIEHYRKRIARIESEGEAHRRDFEPGCHRMPRGVDNVPAVRWMSDVPNLDIRHGKNLSASRWSQDQFRDPKACLGWTLTDHVPGWGQTKGCFSQLLESIGGVRHA